MSKRRRPRTCYICEMQSSTDICANCGVSRKAISHVVTANVHVPGDFNKLNPCDIKRMIDQTKQTSDELWLLTSPSYQRRTLPEFRKEMLGHMKYKSAVMVPATVMISMVVGSVSCYAHIEWLLSPLYSGAIGAGLLTLLGWGVASRIEDYADAVHPVPRAPISIYTALMNRTLHPWYLDKRWQISLALATGFAMPIIYSAAAHSK